MNNDNVGVSHFSQSSRTEVKPLDGSMPLSKDGTWCVPPLSQSGTMSNDNVGVSLFSQSLRTED